MDGTDQGDSSGGFWSQLRGQHPAVKVILALVALVVSSPLTGFLAMLAYLIADGLGVFVVLAGVGAGAIWFVVSKPPSQAPPPARDVPQYCEACGSEFGLDSLACPVCHAPASGLESGGGIASVARFLNALGAEYQAGRLDGLSFARIRTEHERRLWEMRHAAAAAAAAAPPPPPPVLERPSPRQTPAVPQVEFAGAMPPPPPGDVRAAATFEPELAGPEPPLEAGEPELPVAAGPRRGVRDLGRVASGWAAERQADILLYVGAFLLSVAAIIFVASAGEALDGNVRFAVLTAYAVGFLGLGLALHRWERVKEAGPVFLALGAILVPLDFVALRTQVLSQEQLPDDALWLLASSTCAGLYFLLAARGYGWLYALPGVPAALVAWGALGSLFSLPDAWFGPWFAVVAALMYVASIAMLRRAPVAKWALGLAVLLGVAAVAWTQVAVAATGDDRPALPVAYLIAAAAVSAGLYWHRAVAALAVLPPLAALTAGSALWATFGLSPEWHPAFAAGAGLGYLALALFDNPGRTPGWRAVAAACALLGPLVAHLWIAANVGADRWALPAAYLPAFSAVLIAAARWRFGWRPGPAAVPVVTAATALTAAWAAWALPAEWFPCFAAAAGAGYLVVAHLDRPPLARAWGGLAALAGAVAIVGVHAAVAPVSASHAALPAAYGITLAGCIAAFVRWRWIEAGAVLPPSAAATALTIVWASAGLGLEWYASFAAAAALGYLLLARFDLEARISTWQAFSVAAGALALTIAYATLPAAFDGERLALPLAHAILLVGASAATAQWRFSWRTAPGGVPFLAALAAITGAWAAWDLGPEWYGAFLAAAALGFVALAWCDTERWARTWLRIGGVPVVVGLTLSQAWQVDPGAEHSALPVAYGLALFAATVAVARWRLGHVDAVAALPPLAAAFGAALCWAAFEMPLEWLSAWVALAAAGYAVPAILDPLRRNAWRAPSLIGGGIALFAAHRLALDPEPVRWQLPASYLVLLAGWAAQAVKLRDSSVLLPPVLTALAGASVLWAADTGPQWWPYPAIAVSALLMSTSRWWEGNRAFGPSGWAYAVLLGAVATVAVLPADYRQPAHGAVAQLLAAGLMFAASVRANGRIASLLAGWGFPAGRTAEWTILVQASFAFGYGAAASLNGVLEITAADRAWAFAAIASAGWLLVAARVRGPDGFWAFAPVGFVGTIVAGIVAAESDGTVTGVLALAALGATLGFLGSRRWLLLGVANSFLFLGIWSAWRWQEVSLALLPVGFAVLALVEWAALLTFRKYSRRPGEQDYVITYISWGPWLLAGVVAGILLGSERADLQPGTSIVNTREWGLAAAVLAMAAAAVTAEGFRLGKRWVWIVGSAALLGALLMAIATRQPGNVQAYTAPIGIYLIGVALTFRRSTSLFRDQLYWHEAVMLAGALLLVLPPAEQSFEPGGGVFGLELLGVGLALLVVGILLHARWLVAASVLTLTATSVRMVTGGLFSTPYWLLLGIAGTALIGFGLLVLLERERWDRFRARVVDWWSVAQRPPPGLAGPTA